MFELTEAEKDQDRERQMEYEIHQAYNVKGIGQSLIFWGSIITAASALSLTYADKEPQSHITPIDFPSEKAQICRAETSIEVQKVSPLFSGIEEFCFNHGNEVKNDYLVAHNAIDSSGEKIPKNDICQDIPSQVAPKPAFLEKRIMGRIEKPMSRGEKIIRFTTDQKGIGAGIAGILLGIYIRMVGKKGLQHHTIAYEAFQEEKKKKQSLKKQKQKKRVA